MKSKTRILEKLLDLQCDNSLLKQDCTNRPSNLFQLLGDIVKLIPDKPNLTEERTRSTEWVVFRDSVTLEFESLNKRVNEMGLRPVRRVGPKDRRAK